MKIAKRVFVASTSFFAGAGVTLAAASGWNVSNYSNLGLPSDTIYNIIEKVVMWALGIFGFIAIIGFVISGVMYLTSAGDDTAMKKAKNQMIWSLTGVVVGLIGMVIVITVNTLLGGTESVL